MIPGFCREVDKKCTLLRYYAVSNGNSIILFGFLTLEDGTNRMSRNIGKELTLLSV